MRTSFLSLAITVVLLTGATAMAADEYSVAEKRVFLDEHLKNIKHAGTLTYTIHQTGKPDESFDDQATVTIKETDGKKTASVDYLSGTHQLALPDVGDAQANPVILYFLEADVRDMHRAVGGQDAYFRKRIRLALADKATVKPVTVSFNGRNVSASEVRIAPYLDDPLKERFGKFATKTYSFTISDKIPGGVFAIETQVNDGIASKSAPVPIMKTSLTLKSAV